MSANAIGRRDFLVLAGAVVSSVRLQPDLLAGADVGSVGLQPDLPSGAPRIRVGYQIFGWGRYFPSAWWKGAATVGALGYRGIEGEYTIAELYEGREEEFEEGMRRAGVGLAALYSTTDLERPGERVENIRKNMQAAAFCQRMGSRMIVVGGTEARGGKDADLYKRYAGEANELGKRVYETHGVRVGVHPHVGSLVETREEIARVMDGTDPRFFFLAPDTGHLIAGGSDPVEVFRTYRDRIVHAHLKDWAPPPTPGARGAFQPLGKGKVDFPALLNVLQGGSFDGWLDVELDGGRDIDPAQVAKTARDYITSTLKLSLDEGTATSTGSPRS